MAKSIGSIDVNSTLELAIQLAAGTTGQPSSELLVALREAGTANNYLDFNDLTFKTSAWTTRQAQLSELSASDAPGYYNTTVDLSSVTGLPAAGGALVAEYAVNTTSPSFTDYSDEYWNLTDVAASVWDAPVVDHQLADTVGLVQLINRYLGEFGPGAWVSNTGATSSVVGVDAISTNPMSGNFAALWTLMDALDLRIVYGVSNFDDVPTLPTPPGGTRSGYIIRNVLLLRLASVLFEDSTFYDCVFRQSTGVNPSLHGSNVYKNCSFELGSTAGLVMAGRFEDCIFQAEDGNVSFVDGPDQSDLRIYRGRSWNDDIPFRLSTRSSSGSFQNQTYISWIGSIRLSTLSTFQWGRLHVHLFGGRLELDASFDMLAGAIIVVSGFGEFVNNSVNSGWTVDTSAFYPLTETDLTPVTDAIDVLSGEVREVQGYVGRNKVNEVLTRDAKGNPLTQEIRLYDTGPNAETDDGVTGLLRRIPTIIGEFEELAIDEQPFQALTRLRMSDFAAVNAVGTGATNINTVGTGTARGEISTFNQADDFDAGKPSWLSEFAGVGSISYSSSNAVLDANGNEADYTGTNQLMLYHALAGLSDSARVVLGATYANPDDGTADAINTYSGVFFEDETGAQYLVNYGTSRGTGSSQWIEGQKRVKGDEGYNWFDDDTTIPSPAGRIVRIEYIGQDINGDAEFEVFSQGVSQGTEVMVGMGVPTRCGLVFYSFGANSDPADRVAFDDISLSYDFFA